VRRISCVVTDISESLRVNMAGLHKIEELDSISRMDLGGSIKSHIHNSSSWRYVSNMVIPRLRNDSPLTLETEVSVKF
jgi:hypothetical protein